MMNSKVLLILLLIACGTQVQALGPYRYCARYSAVMLEPKRFCYWTDPRDPDTRVCEYKLSPKCIEWKMPVYGGAA